MAIAPPEERQTTPDNNGHDNEKKIPKWMKYGGGAAAAGALALGATFLLGGESGEAKPGDKPVSPETSAPAVPGQVESTEFTPENNTSIASLSEEEYLNFTLDNESYALSPKLQGIATEVAGRVETPTFTSVEDTVAVREGIYSNIETVFGEELTLDKHFSSLDELVETARSSYDDEFVAEAIAQGMPREQLNTYLAETDPMSPDNKALSYGINRIMRDTLVMPTAEKLGINETPYTISVDGEVVTDEQNILTDMHVATLYRSNILELGQTFTAPEIEPVEFVEFEDGHMADNDELSMVYKFDLVMPHPEGDIADVHTYQSRMLLTTDAEGTFGMSTFDLEKLDSTTK